MTDPEPALVPARARPSRAPAGRREPVPLHESEEARLAALHSLDILDTVAEQRFDRLTALTADVFDVPMVAISLVDRNRQWFKSSVGLDICETSRDEAFCARAILEREMLVVPDALADGRFCQNLLVVGTPFLRFYAGAALRTASALPLGTLCIMDLKPRDLDQAGRRRLRLLAEIVEQEIQNRFDLMELRRRAFG